MRQGIEHLRYKHTKHPVCCWKDKNNPNKEVEHLSEDGLCQLLCTNIRKTLVNAKLSLEMLMKDSHFGFCCCLHIFKKIILMLLLLIVICRFSQDSWENFLIFLSMYLLLKWNNQTTLGKKPLLRMTKFYIQITPFYHYHQMWKRKTWKIEVYIRGLFHQFCT